jgi:hypothetical protein
MNIGVANLLGPTSADQLCLATHAGFSLMPRRAYRPPSRREGELARSTSSSREAPRARSGRSPCRQCGRVPRHRQARMRSSVQARFRRIAGPRRKLRDARRGWNWRLPHRRISSAAIATAPCRPLRNFEVGLLPCDDEGDVRSLLRSAWPSRHLAGPRPASVASEGSELDGPHLALAADGGGEGPPALTGAGPLGARDCLLGRVERPVDEGWVVRER